VVRLHEWCDPMETRKRGTHNRRPIAEFSVQLSVTHPDRIRAAMASQAQLLRDLIDDSVAAGALTTSDSRRASTLILQTVQYSWVGKPLRTQPKERLSRADNSG